jgi:hypothetical protein
MENVVKLKTVDGGGRLGYGAVIRGADYVMRNISEVGSDKSDGFADSPSVSFPTFTLL